MDWPTFWNILVTSRITLHAFSICYCNSITLFIELMHSYSDSLISIHRATIRSTTLSLVNTKLHFTPKRLNLRPLLINSVLLSSLQPGYYTSWFQWSWKRIYDSIRGMIVGRKYPNPKFKNKRSINLIIWLTEVIIY